MRVLVTGSAGHIGRHCIPALIEAGHTVRKFDRTASPPGDGENVPGDLRDIAAVRAVAQGMEAVVHLGALAHDRAGAPEDILNVNVQGTCNVLFACSEAGIKRVVNFSSVNALGCVGGRRLPVQFPISDSYPRHPLSPYQLSKQLGEDACTSFAAQYSMQIASMRPGYVIAPSQYARWIEYAQSAEAGYGKAELWAYVDIRDVTDAIVRALTSDLNGHEAFLLFSTDTTLKIPTADLVGKYLSDVPWPDISLAEYTREQPFRSLFDCSEAERRLGWRARHTWRSSAAAEQV